MDGEKLHRALLFDGGIPLVFLRNRLAKKSNYDYSHLLSNFSDIGFTPWSGHYGELDDHDLKSGFAESGRLAAQVSENTTLQSDTLIRYLVKVSVGCLAGQTRISHHFIPGLFKNRPYEKILDQLVSDMRSDDFDLGLAHSRIQQIEGSKSTLASIVFPAGIHRLCQTSPVNLRRQFGPLISATSDIDHAIENAASDAFTLVRETKRANEALMRDRFKRYLEGFDEYEALKASRIAKEAAELQSDLEHTVDYFHAGQYDDKEIIKIVRDAADGGMAKAQFALGQMLTFVDNPDKDFDAAAMFYLKAANQNHRDSQWKLSRLYVEGNGVIESADHALRWTIKAAENGHYDAIYELASGFLYGHREYFSSDLDQAEKWLSVLAESDIWLGENRYLAQARLGECHRKKGDLVEAYKWYLVSDLEVSADFKSSEDRHFKTKEYEVENWNKKIAESLEEIAKEMTSEMISAAKTKAVDWWEERSLNPKLR